MLAPCRAADDRAHIRRGPAHVEGDRVLEAGERRDSRSTDHTRRRPREKRERRVGCGLLQRRHPARRAHDERGMGDPPRSTHLRARRGSARAQARGTRRQRSSRRARTRGTRARPRGTRRCGPRVPAPELADDGTLGAAVAEREEQRDGYRLRIELGQCVEVERDELTLGACSPTHAHAALERHERRWMLGARTIEVRARLATEVKHVLEALVRHECRARPAALEQRVGRDGRAVGEPLDLLGADCRGGCDHRLLLPRRRRHLRDADLAVVDQNGIREGPAHVDSQRTHDPIRT